MQNKQERFLRVYKPVHEQFERFCRVRVYGYMDHRDLVNDTLLVAFEKFDKLRSEKAFLSFLCGIAVRLLANHNKKRKEVHLMDSDEIMNFSNNEKTDSWADVFILYKALARLPEAQRESIILFEITGFSIREIAAMQGVSEPTVRQRLRRGRNKLKEMLQPTPISITGKP